MPWFYLSFASVGRGHLGSTVVEAKNERDAVEVASARGLNPGGEAMIMRVPKDRLRLPTIAALKYQLLSEAEIKQHGPVTKGRASNAAYACELCNSGIPHKH